MGRIRSIHPGLAVDDAFVAMSLPAKACWPLLWVECDDFGLFHWKPAMLHRLIMPSEDIDFGALLDEYERLGVIRAFDFEGRKYGAVRNFRRWQSPRRPRAMITVPSEILAYVTGPGAVQEEEAGERVPSRGRSDYDAGRGPVPARRSVALEISRPVAVSTDVPSSENATIENIDDFQDLYGHVQHMSVGVRTNVANVRLEREKEREKEEKNPSTTTTEPGAARDAARRVVVAMGRDWKDPTWFGDCGLVHQWLANGWDLDLDILPTVEALSRARADGPPRSLGYFTAAIGRAHERRLAARAGARPVPAPIAGDLWPALTRDGFTRGDVKSIDLLCKSWFDRGQWHPDWGAKPGEAGAFVTADEAAAWKGRKAGNVVDLDVKRVRG